MTLRHVPIPIADLLLRTIVNTQQHPTGFVSKAGVKPTPLDGIVLIKGLVEHWAAKDDEGLAIARSVRLHLIGISS